jgi:F-type H+-transporting ATPase subunit b
MSPAELWIVVSTVIFLVLVFRPARKAVNSGLDARRDEIVRELDEAHRLRAEAETLLADAKERHRTAAQDAAGIAAFAREEAERQRAAAEAELKTQIARREKQASDRIAQAEAAAVAEIKTRAVDLALTASRTMLARKLSGDAGDRLIDETIAALPGKLTAVR